MSRYSEISITNNENPNIANIGARYYVTNSYPEIPLNSNDIYAITDFGDRLDILANQFYGDTTLYWVIASANPDLVPNDSLSLKGGIQLRIPADINSILNNYDIINGLGGDETGGIPNVAGTPGISSTFGGGGGGGY
jgi:phage tail protein X